jgi:natural product biosynthesis luciferase-like monooxygenase protein
MASDNQHGASAGDLRPLAFSLFYFASDDGGTSTLDKRRLLFDSARFADCHDFSAVWVPERHFHAFGGLSPNPSVTAAALATITEKVRIRSGSVVLPLHQTLRVAEEWALVDFLSNGRVDLGLAAGWFPNDFVLAPPGTYERRNALLFERLQELRGLWRGEPVDVVNPLGDKVRLLTMPRPVQTELPVWITAAGNPETFRQAGLLGANVLTHLLGQTMEALEEKIKLYRAAWQESGHPGRGCVTLMLHTFIGEDNVEVRPLVKGPMLRYLGSSAQLASHYTSSVPFFQSRCAVDAGAMSKDDLDAALEFSFERYYQTNSLLGSLDDCLERTDRIRAIGVDEIACLIDFGMPVDAVLDALPRLDELRQLANVSEDEVMLALG